ncbi:TrbC/VirB2 family protein [Sphingomonas sp. GB1N7]|uniref:TrbC/VirB2 family protein n=1 Tax=Parasphingomonas caseinilytica TaxID=3096158 RepID=UPI002FCC5C00
MPLDPGGLSSLAAAVIWLQDTLLGTVATTVAIIAVAVAGMLMFFGRIDVRRGLGIVIGCFVLFGASSIAVGIQTAVAPSASYYLPISPQPGVPVAMQQPPAPKPRPPYDPYAGASVPPR